MGVLKRLRFPWIAIYFLVVALCVMQPFHGSGLVESASGDLTSHVAAIVEAKAALAEGQFPLRVAPHASDGTRYPLFSFYGNLPYTLTAALSKLSGIGPYASLRVVLLVALWIGGCFAFRCAKWMTRDRRAAMVAGTAFAMAPYVFVDLYARTAFPEVIGFMLLPVALYYALRTLARGRLSDGLAGAVAWAAIALSHNVIFLFGSIAIAGYVLTMTRASRRHARRLVRVAGSYGLGVLLVLWYIVPQALTVSGLWIAHHNAATPVGAPALTALDVLLWPTMKVPAGSNTPGLGLQVGWPILFGALLAVAALFFRRRSVESRRRAVPGLLIVFLVSFLFTWSPDFIGLWRFTPKLFWHVQSSYRLLAFVTLWGALLIGWSFAAWIPKRFATIGLIVALLAIALTASSYVRPLVPLRADVLPGLIANPDLGGNGARDNFLFRPDVAMRTTPAIPALNYAGTDIGVMRDGWLVDEQQPFLVWPPPTGWRLEMDGELPPQYFKDVNLIWCKLGDEQLAPVLVPAGPFRLSWPVTAPQTQGPIGLTVATVHPLSAADMGGLAPPRSDVIRAKVNRLQFRPPSGSTQPAGQEAYLPASSLRGSTDFGRKTEVSVTLNESTLVQLPVLHYPKMLRVWDNGQRVDCGNVGLLASVRLGPGTHRLQIEHAGIAWANGGSAIAWIAVALGAVASMRKRCWHRSAANTGSRAMDAREPVFAAVVVLIGCLGATTGAALWQRVDGMVHPTIACTYRADRAYSPTSGAEQAFDGNPDTAWIVNGPSPAKLTVLPAVPAVLSRIDFEPRQTTMLEAWNRMHVELFLDEERVAVQDYAIRDAFTARQTSIVPPTVEADRFEITFSDPVILLPDGVTVATDVNPGYREIRLRWEGSLFGFRVP